ncbi:MAG: hypothetical protein JJU34_03905 [Lunatimonas sp.]|uniref:hypothetical protein n=1 Tax=Lunatimonas sp. TaxID=2060141 RepID=UPI00263AC4E4|nr:hypothetical protein [Lunatimonas sp.]MCC5936401.1 hypothetical protein [Lunatimonas sp.]
MRWIFCILWLLTFSLHAQERGAPYVHHLELGVLQGSDDFGTRINPSIKSLHGVQFHPNHSFGFLLGLDVYPLAAIVPFGMGWRGTLHPEKKTTWMAGMDLGYGSMVLEKKMVTEWNQHTWFEGGLMAHPTVGIRKKNKGKTAWSFLFGYKHQSANYYMGLPVVGVVNPTPNPSNPSDWSSLRTDRIRYRNLTFSVGLLFL